MVKMYPAEGYGSHIQLIMRQPYAVEHTTLISKQFHASTGSYVNKIFILYTIHQDKLLEQSIFPRSFTFVFNSRIGSLYLTYWPNCSKVDMP